MNNGPVIKRNNAAEAMKQFCKKWLRLRSAGLALLLTTSCQSTDVIAKEPVTVTIAGATAMQPVLYALTDEFSRQHPYVFFDIAGGGSTIGEERVWQEQVDLAASTLISPTLPPGGSAVSSAKLTRIPIGLDGLAIIVHRENRLANITLIELQELYSGRQWNWQAFGGQDAEILLVTREAGSGAHTLFTARVMGQVPIALTAVVMPTSADVVDYVASHPTAIGYVSRAYVVDELVVSAPITATATTTTPTAEPKPAKVRVVALENQLPTTAALQAQSYHLIQPLYLVSRNRPRDWAKQFIDFALSPRGQAIIARYHLPIRRP